MGISAQVRIKKIEDAIKAMKACYNTAGSLVKMYVQKSSKYTVGGSSGYHSVTIKFTPKYNRGQSNLITLYPIINSGENTAPARQLPQDGSGDVYITVFNVLDTDVIEIVASGVSEGTFTRTA